MDHAERAMPNVCHNGGAEPHEGDDCNPCPDKKRWMYDWCESDEGGCDHHEITERIEFASQIARRFPRARDGAVGDVGQAAKRVDKEERGARGRGQEGQRQREGDACDG